MNLLNRIWTIRWSISPFEVLLKHKKLYLIQSTYGLQQVGTLFILCVLGSKAGGLNKSKLLGRQQVVRSGTSGWSRVWFCVTLVWHHGKRWLMCNPVSKVFIYTDTHELVWISYHLHFFHHIVFFLNRENFYLFIYIGRDIW
jgi:hypothetical protein